MKITKKNLERLITEEVTRVIKEFERDSLYYKDSRGKEKARKTGRWDSPLDPEANARVLMDILAKLSEIEGKIDELSGKAPVNLP
jgi:uncharacterized lipoprotein YmbA